MKPGCICYLVRATPHDIKDFIGSLTSLHKCYLRNWPCDVYAFHEADLTEKNRQHILNKSPVALKFVKLKFESPIELPPLMKKRAQGYRHMCHFFANDIFHRPELDGYQYYLRLDTDSRILSRVKYDLFTLMKDKDKRYGFITDRFNDQPCFAVGLWARFAEFVTNHPEHLTYKKLYTEIPELKIYYTNFEICDIAWFRSEPWVSFFKWIDEAQGIYIHRWGDHTIRYAGVNLYMDPRQIARLPVHYFHQFEFGEEHKCR